MKKMGKDKRLSRPPLTEGPRSELEMYKGSESYLKVKDSLCITAARRTDTMPACHEYVTKNLRFITLTLCRLVIQGDERFAEPIRKSEAAGWNTDLYTIIKNAEDNTFSMFPANIYDLKTGHTVTVPYAQHAGKYSPSVHYRGDRSSENGDYDISPSLAGMAAEAGAGYETGAGSDLRFIINADPIVGELLLIYPSLLRSLGRKTERDPIILACAPGKLYVFDTARKKESFDRYLERYKKRAGDSAYTPHIYKYFRKNNALSDTFQDTFKCKDIREEAHIPPWSVVSAWGDMGNRYEMFEWIRSKYVSEDKKEG